MSLHQKYVTTHSKRTYQRSINTVIPDELKLIQSWSVKEREFLNELVDFLREQGPLSWTHVQKFFPMRSRQQIKTYYYNSVKQKTTQQTNNISTLMDIDLDRNGLQSQEAKDFLFRYFGCCGDLETLKANYPTENPNLITHLFNSVTQIVGDIMGSSPFVNSYPNCKAEFHSHVLDNYVAMFHVVEKKREEIMKMINSSSSVKIKQNALATMSMLTNEKIKKGLSQIALIRRDMERNQAKNIDFIL